MGQFLVHLVTRRCTTKEAEEAKEKKKLFGTHLNDNEEKEGRGERAIVGCVV